MNNLTKTFKVYYRYVAEKRLLFGSFLVVAVLSVIANSLTPYFYKLFVDSIQNSDFDRLLTVLYWYVGIKVVHMLLHSLDFTLGDANAVGAGIKLRTDVVKKIHDLDFSFHSKKSTGSLISAIKRGDGAFWSLFHSIHHNFLAVIVGVSVMFFFLRDFDYRINAIIIVSFAIGIVITKLVVSHNIKVRKEFNKSEDELSGVITDNIINYETVKLFAKERWERKRLAGKFKSWKSKLWRYIYSFRILDVSIGTVVNVAIFLVLYLTMQDAIEQTISVGDFVLIAGYVNAIFPQLFNVVWASREIAKDYADIEKYISFLDLEVEIKDPVNPKRLANPRGEIVFDNVSFSYDRKSRAVKNIKLKIRPGESVAFVGSSGVGKTTLTKLLMRFYDVDTGKITIDGISIKDFTKSYLRSLMGVVPQEPVMFNNTILFNIKYGNSSASEEQVIAAAKMANLNSFVLGLKKGYLTNVGERGIKLSGGQKQRLAIARMILSNPKIIIFDEATSQLDSENEKLIQDAFWNVASGKTTLIIAHRLSTAARADRIVVMDKGRIVEEGSHNELVRKENGVYRKFWELQVNV